MNCDDVRPLLSAHLDDELPAQDARAVVAHLETCGSCRRERDAMHAVGPALGNHLPRLDAPELLQRRIQAALREASGRDAPGRTARRRATFWLGQVAAGLVIALASSAITLAVLRRAPSDAGSVVHDVVASHVRSLMSNHLVEVVSNDEHNVKPWFDGRVPFAPEVPRLDSVGFPLIGGRVDTVGTTATAALVYGRRKHTINLFTWPANRAARGAADVSTDTEHGYNVLRWVDGDMQFAAVSDLTTGDLREFVDAFRRSEPVREGKPGPPKQ